MSRRLWIAIGYGLVCHFTFAAAIGSMVVGLHEGMGSGFGRLDGGTRIAANAALVLQFPLLHSALLTDRGSRLLACLAPHPFAQTLSTTTYATIASLQVLAVFALWSPGDDSRWAPSTTLGWAAAEIAYAGSWVYLLRALSEAGLGVQTGWLGWTSVLRGVTPSYPPLPTRGLHARSRHPIYLGFALTLWTAPVWSLDRLVLAICFTLYCAIGPLHKERRLARRHGSGFEEQVRAVPYLLPRIRT